MLPRRMEGAIVSALRNAPAVVLLGPRQVGKTTLARSIASKAPASLYLDLEQPSDQRRLEDAEVFLRAQAGKLVVIDEVHRAPALFGVLRGIIDEWRRVPRQKGRLLLLGSASLELMRQASETLAGRVSYFELAPLDALETLPRFKNLDRLWVRGGFPESVLARSDLASLAWRRSFIRSYLERDIPLFAPRMPAETIRRLWVMLAHAQGMGFNQARLASSLGVSAPAVGRYVDLLVDLLLVRRLQPWSGNIGNRLVRAPKLYIRDSGLTHALLDLNSWSDVLGHPVVGPSWEGFAIENLIGSAGELRIPYYYRTEDGSEVDLLFERAGEIEMAIEIKRSSAPALSRGFHNACAVLAPKHKYVVYPGHDTWPLTQGVTAIPLPDLMTKLAKAPRR